MTTVRFGDASARVVQNAQAAAASAAIGWHVLPWELIAGRKVPKITGWQSGSAFSSVGEVQSWWANNPGHSPGIVCGARSGIWVLDVDPRNGGDKTISALLATHGAIPPDTFMVTTPGGGWHYYFAMSPEVETLRKHALTNHGFPGIDVLADGSWVAAPGAWGEAGRYDLVPGGTELRAAPAWVIALAMIGNPDFAEDTDDHSAVDGTGGWDAWLDGEVRRTANTPPGGQRAALVAFTLALRRRGYARAVADEAALRAMHGLVTDPSQGPWLEADVLGLLDGAWAKFDVAPPINQEWADSVAGPSVIVPSPEDATGGGAAVEAVPEEVEALPVPLPLPPPSPGAAVVGEPPEAVGPDHENALDFRRWADGKLIWLAENDQWQLWDGTSWQPDVTRRRDDMVLDMARSWSDQGALGVDEWRALVARQNALGRVSGMNTCLQMAKHMFAVNMADLDGERDWINTPSGMVNLETGQVRPAAPADLVTKLTSAEYDPGARDEVWERVLEEVIPSPVDRMFFQRWAGYCLTGRTSEKIILAIHGPAGSGKSTVSEPFAKAMGQYAAVWQPDVIVDRSGVNIDEAMYRVRGARLVTVSEMRRGTRLNEGVMKNATGADTVAARGLYMSGMSYRPQFKLWVHTNFVPDSADDALMARFAFLKMGRQFTRGEQDPGVKTYLEEDASAQRAILAWAVQGWVSVLQGGSVGRPEHSDDEAAEHLLRSDPVRRFMLETMVQSADPGDGIDSAMTYAAYEAWCREERIAKPFTLSRFINALEERGLERVRFVRADGVRVRGYKGWTIRQADSGVNAL